MAQKAEVDDAQERKMQDTRLIMLEGLPGTGKTTNAHFLRTQLERNGKTVEWVHEVARPHPTLFFQEASLTYAEFDVFLQAHPAAAEILRKTAVHRDKTVGFDLLEMEWEYQTQIGKETLQALRQYDVWKLPIERYREATKEKWTCFAERAMHDRDTVYILDASMFQFHIFTFLLQNIAYEKLEQFIRELADIIKPLHPDLIYFHRENPAESVAFLEQSRGTKYLEYLWERDKAEAFYADKPAGAEGVRLFLQAYADAAARLFRFMDCRKLSLEISKQDWKAYEQEMLSFMGIEYMPDIAAVPKSGVYINTFLDLKLEIDGFVMKDPGGTNRRLTPKTKDAFYVEGLPTVIRFDKNGDVLIADGQINKRWTTRGTKFLKMKKNGL